MSAGSREHMNQRSTMSRDRGANGAQLERRVERRVDHSFGHKPKHDILVGFKIRYNLFSNYPST